MSKRPQPWQVKKKYGTIACWPSKTVHPCSPKMASATDNRANWCYPHCVNAVTKLEKTIEISKICRLTGKSERMDNVGVLKSIVYRKSRCIARRSTIPVITTILARSRDNAVNRAYRYILYRSMINTREDNGTNYGSAFIKTNCLLYVCSMGYINVF